MLWCVYTWIVVNGLDVGAGLRRPRGATYGSAQLAQSHAIEEGVGEVGAATGGTVYIYTMCVVVVLLVVVMVVLVHADAHAAHPADNVALELEGKTKGGGGEEGKSGGGKGGEVM